MFILCHGIQGKSCTYINSHFEGLVQERRYVTRLPMHWSYIFLALTHQIDHSYFHVHHLTTSARSRDSTVNLQRQCHEESITWWTTRTSAFYNMKYPTIISVWLVESAWVWDYNRKLLPPMICIHNQTTQINRMLFLFNLPYHSARRSCVFCITIEGLSI